MPVPVVLTILGNIAGAVLGKVADHLFAPIQRKFKYMCCFDSNITELEAQLETFQRTRQGLQLRVDNDRANVRIIDPNVEAWLQSASKVTTEVEGITQEKPKVKEGCLNGWCPNLKLRYSLSRKAVKKIEVVDDLQKKGAQYTHTQISYNPPLASLDTIPSRDSKGFESRWFIMEEIIKSLKHDEINLIGVCGMGGAGKTTMVNEVAKRAKEDNNFDEVAMAVVGQEPNLTNVQACIADMLGLKLGDRDSPIVRSDLLHKRLLQDNKKILVILDDIWAEFDLQRMGIPLGGDNKNLKMLYTSRIQDLWHERRTKKEIPLELLSEDEAWQLFKEKVGDSADAPSLQHIAKQIVKKCGRLPLALVLIGSALSKSKGNHIKETWEDMLYRLNSSSRNKDLLELLETSYKYLEYDEAKRLFLLCCLFKEDESIDIEDLARYAFGLSIFDGIDEITKARHRVVALVSDLKSRYLLQESKCFYYLDECVKVHDVVRDMGISIASRDEPALVSHGGLSKWPRKDTYERYTSISVISEKITELPEGLTCSNLELLLLRCSNLQKVPCHFFEGMEKLKVLDLKYFRGILTFQPLRNLTTLSLEGFGGVLDNVRAIGDLVNLEILSFRYSKIEELPEEIGELVNLRLLDLHYTFFLKRIPRGVISRLVCLEELYMFDGGFKNWEEEEGKENANLGEFKSLSNLNTLEIDISSGDITIPIAPIFAKLKMYKAFIGGKSGEFIRKGQGKRVLSVYRSTPTPSYPSISLLRSSDGLYLGGEGCNDLVRELLLQDGVDGLQQLKRLEIYDCDTPECLVNTMNLFPVLECLGLYSLSYLRQICRGPVLMGSFREITELKVKKCGLLENLFELPIGGCLAQLKILSIESCIMMKEVFRKQQREDVPDATKRIEFPKLETLDLEDLPSLVGFCGGIDQIDFPKLKSMDLKSLGKFKRLFHNNNNLSSNSSQEDNFGFLSFFPQKVSLPNLEVLRISKLENLETLGRDLLSMSALSKLKEFSVHFCGKLLCVFPSQLVLMLQNLESLTVVGCHLLDVVFELEGVDTEEPNQEILSALKVVRLFDLPKLIYISKGDPIGFKYVQTLQIDGCHSLRYVFAPTMVNNISQLRHLRIRGCEMLSRIVAEENGMGESTVDEVKFPQLERLELQDLPNLVSLADPTGSFQEITKLNVENCELLENLFELPIGGCFAQLKILTIKSCIMMKEVFRKEQREDVPDATKRIEFPKLETLNLENLPSLVGFGGGIDQIDFPKLQRMDLKSLGNFKSLFHNNNNLSSNSSQEDNFGFLSLFPQKVSLPNLEVLKISKLENLETLGHDLLSMSALSKLKEFSVHYCGKLLCVFPSQLVLMLQNLERLTVVGCHLLDVVSELEGVDTEEPNQEILSALKVVRLRDLPKLIYISKGDPIGFKYVQTLQIDDCHSLRYVFAPTMVNNISQLRHLMIRGCEMLSRIVAEENGMGESTVDEVKFPQLERLELQDLPNLVSLADPTGSFQEITKLNVENCELLENLFELPIGGCFAQLKILTIKSCIMMKEVFRKEQREDVPDATKRIEFPKLETLNLENLPSLVGFCEGIDQIDFPKLQRMDLKSLGNFKSLFHNNSSLSSNSSQEDNFGFLSLSPQKGDPIGFKYIQTLEIEGCHSLRYVFAPTVMKSIPQLRELKIRGCKMLSRIVAEENGMGESSVDEVKFPQLERLMLQDLPNLVSLFPNVNTAVPKSTDSLHNPMQPQSLFNEKVTIPSLKYLKLLGLKNVSDLWCSELPSSSFSKLEKLEVISCTSLRIMFHPSMAGGLVNLKELLIEVCSTLEAVVGKEEEIEGGYKREIDKVEFPRLERLDLQDLPNLVSLFPNVNTALPKSTNSLHNPMQPQSLFNEKVSIPSLKYLKLLGLKNVSDLWCSELPSSSFSKLEKLEVISCTSLRIMFHPSMAGGLVNLKELLIEVCSTLEAVVGKEEEIEGGYKREIDKVEFPRLERLDLQDLPNLVSLFPNVNTALPKSTDSLHNPMQPQSLFNEKVSIPSLKYLKLLGLKNVSDLWCSELPSSSFSKLEKLEVISCTSLRIMFHPSMAGGLVNLKELLIEVCSTLEAVVGKEEEIEGGYKREIDKVEFPRLKRLDLQDLPNLVSLFPNVNTALPKSTDSLHNPMQPQSLFNEKVSIPSLKYLKLLGLKNVSDLWCSELPSSSFSKLEKLEVISCTSLRIMFHPSMAGGLVNLKELLIEVCSTLEAVVGKEEEIEGGYKREIDKVEFPRLERLDLQDLPNLLSLFPNVNTALPKSIDSLHNPMQPQSLFNEKVSIPSLKYLKLLGLKNVSDLWCSELPSSSFSKLEKLEVISCTSLRIMFHPSMAGGLVNLKKLLIEVCSTLEAVVGKEEEIEGGYKREIDKVEFPRLERLDLQDLPNLVSLFPNVNTALPKSIDSLHNPMQPQSLFNEKVSIPSLKYLKLLGLKNVSDLWCSELPSSSFSKLEKLEVISCTSLRIMFHPSMAGGLVNLKELLIEVCSTLELVVGKEEEVVGGGHGSKIDKTLFPQLGKLKLGSLPKLKRFCNSTHPLELPKLSQMAILFCPSIDAFSSEPVCAPNLTLQGISWNGDLNNAIQFLQKNGNGLMARSMEKPRTFDDVTDKFKPWQVAETQCRLVAMPDSTDGAHKVVRLIYTNSGDGVLALGCNGIIRLWKWGGSQHNPSGMATASVVPQEWQPASDLAMTNDVIGAKLEEAVPCIALVKNDSEVFSACGGVISLFNMKTFKVMRKFMPPPPASTFLASYPLDNDFIAIGREDSTICIHNVWLAKVKSTLKGHQKRITGLAFSTILKLLVSSGADAQLCIWSIDTWVMLKSVPIQLPAGKARDCDTRVQFHSGQIRLLVFHETQLAIYDASKMDRICQWVPQDVLPAPISCATYSCDDQLVYVSFCDGNIGVFDANSLTLRCHIAPSVYLSPALLSGSQAVYPLVVAAHPRQPNQFAIGLTDGSVIVMELPTITGLDGGTASSSNASNQTPGPGENVDVDEVLDEDVDEDALITNRSRVRTTTMGTHGNEEDFEEEGEDVDVDEVLEEDVDEDALITNRSRVRTATMGTHDNEEDLEEKRKKEEEEEWKKKKGKAPLLDEHEEY